MTEAAKEQPVPASANMYDYDEEAASHAEDFANRIDDKGAFVGIFTNVWPLTTKIKDDGTGGTEGVHFEFETIANETASFDLYTKGPKGTKRKDGTTRTETEKFPGYNQLMAMQFLMGLKGLKTKKGKIEVYDDEAKKRVEVDGDTFPDLIGRKIGIIFQKELYNKNTGAEASRINFLASFHPETRLTSSEIKANEKHPKKYEKIMKGLKTKDSRTRQGVEPDQPSQGIAAAGDY